jgi:heterotetrameric sarcosine oxidase gamma subunit
MSASNVTGLIPAAPFVLDSQRPPGAVGLVARYLDSVGIVSVRLRREFSFSTFSQRMRMVCGVEPPLQLQCAIGGSIRLVAVGPESWLAIGAANLFTVLREGIAESTSLTDQSSGYIILRLTGPRVRETFAKLIPIDFHPHAFAIGNAAATVAAHIGVTVWRCADDAGGYPTFELACLRSFSADLVEALRRSAAEFGFLIVSASAE